jgi:hypothetical protein
MQAAMQGYGTTLGKPGQYDTATVDTARLFLLHQSHDGLRRGANAGVIYLVVETIATDVIPCRHDEAVIYADGLLGRVGEDEAYGQTRGQVQGWYDTGEVVTAGAQAV